MDVARNAKLLRSQELDRIYRAHSTWLRGELRRSGGSVAPEDLVQDTFLQISLYPATVPLRFPRALLLKIAKNLLRSSIRRDRRTQQINPDGGACGGRTVVSAEQFELIVLKETILALPEIYRDVFMLSRFDGMSYKEIAQARGLSPKTVESRMSKALAMCAARMRE